MHNEYSDIIEAANRPPLWWDENGVPRFAEHHPRHCPDIYADEVALLRVACQECAREFLVQMSIGRYEVVVAEMRHFQALPEGVERDENARDFSLAGQVRSGAIHYGDPPRHDTSTDCIAGDTMNVNDLAIVEFWRLSKDPGRWEWERVAELEIGLQS